MMPESALSAHIARELERVGHVVVADFLEKATIVALADECRLLDADTRLDRASVGRARNRHVDASVRGDRTHWLDPGGLIDAEAQYWRRMHSLRSSLNRTLLLGLLDLESHYALFAPGTRYARHRDRFRSDDARVLSSVLYLNPGWLPASGGQLRLYLGAGAQAAHVDVFPDAGTLVLFLSAEFEHEVLPATRDRLSIAGWMRQASIA